MESLFDRRSFLKTTAGAAAGLAGLSASRLPAAGTPQGTPNAEKIGWRLGCALYTFNQFPFYEAVERNASLGLRYAEGFTWHKLSKERPNLQTNESLSADLRKEVKQKLADSGVKLVNVYCNLGNDEAAARKTFDFAKEMGIETLVAEPPAAAFDLIEKLCDEYQINLGVHNHPGPASTYWNPDKVLEVCKGRSKRIGACADTGHWMRSGIEPLAAIKKLEGRIITFHFKDLNAFGPGAHDVPWGTGKGSAKAVLAEVHRQGLKAMFSIEYEHNWGKNLPELAQCVAFFDKTAAELA